MPAAAAPLDQVVGADQSMAPPCRAAPRPRRPGSRMLSTPPRFEPLELFGARRRLRHHAPEVGRQRRAAAGGEARRGQRPRDRQRRPVAGTQTTASSGYFRLLRHRVSSPSARRRSVAGPPALAPLPDHHDSRPRSRRARDRDQDRDQRRGAAAVAELGAGAAGDRLCAGAWPAGLAAACLGYPAWPGRRCRRAPAAWTSPHGCHSPARRSVPADAVRAAELRPRPSRRQPRLRAVRRGLPSSLRWRVACPVRVGRRDLGILEPARRRPERSTGKQANASRASTDRSEKASRPELRAGWWRVRCMARKVRGNGGVARAGRPDRRPGPGWRRLRRERPPHRRAWPYGCVVVALLVLGAASRATLGRPFYWAAGLIVRSGAFVCNLIPLVGVGRAQRDRGRPRSGLPRVLPCRIPDRPNRPKAPTFR